MKQIRNRLTYANVMSSMAVFLILGGATAIAASNKIGANQLKANSVKTGKIVKEAVKAGKLAKNSVTTPKIANDAVTSEKINESTLGTVPSAVSANTATTATTASNLVGQTPFLVRLGLGQSQTIASHGVVSLVATCDQSGGSDRVRILMQTSQSGAVANGEDDFDGSSAAEFLNVDTAADDRVFLEETTTAGKTLVSYEYDQGWVLGPDLKMLTTNSEGIALGLNYGGSTCLVAGVVNAVG